MTKYNFVNRRRRYVAEAGQRHRQGALRWPRRCLPVRHSCRTSPARLGRKARLPPQPATGPLPAHRQQARDETLRFQESVDEGADQAEGGGTLGHTSVQ